jgi:hypothetical protein
VVIAVELPAPTKRAARRARVVVVFARGRSKPIATDIALASAPNVVVDVACISTAIEEPLAGLSEPGETANRERAPAAHTEEAVPSLTDFHRTAPMIETDAPAPSARALKTLPRDDPTRAMFIVQPRVEIGSRHFDYVDRVSSNLRSYDLSATPRFGIGAEVYAWRGLGVSGDYTSAVGLQSAGTDGQSVDTSWTSFDAAVKYRISVAEGSAVTPKVGYGQIDFDIAPDPTLPPSNQLPSATYRFVRTGVDGRLALGRFAAMAGIDYLFVSSAGAADERFPQASIGGLEARMGVGYKIASHFEARTGLAYQRFFYDLRPEKGDAFVAGGALDHYARWESALAFSY